MTNNDTNQTGRSQTSAQFPPTRWTLVMNQKNPAALEELCTIYRPAVYAFLRQQDYTAPDADDLTNGFFEVMLSKDRLNRADRARGRFRTFLMRCVKNFTHNVRARRMAEKRGNGGVEESIFTGDPETGNVVDPPSDELDPAAAFLKGWALALIRQVRTNLENKYAGDGKSHLFDKLVGFLTGDGADYQTVASELGMSEGSVRVAVHRLRKEYGEFLRAEVGRTVDTDAEIEEEIRYLLSVLARG